MPKEKPGEVLLRDTDSDELVTEKWDRVHPKNWGLLVHNYGDDGLTEEMNYLPWHRVERVVRDV